jgi:nucleoside 2-deoxyribosyltransferase
MLLYLAGPLFSVAQRDFNRHLATEIEGADRSISVVLPQDRAKLFLGQPGAHQAIFEDCLTGVRDADVVVAILDGEDVDSGTALEMGYAMALGRPILGLRTDLRASEERGVNLMVAFACRELSVDIDASVHSLARKVVDFCRSSRQGANEVRGSLALAPLPLG